jgi:NAD(P)-dependent dehydrogenase (short-subunit alcohol dehydrogenase family)
MSVPPGSKCLVTGATNPTSIGFVAARTLLKAGASHVTIMGRSKEKLDSAVSLLSKDSGSAKVSGVLGDLKHPETMAIVVEEAIACMGGGGLDILVVSGGNGYSEYLGLDPNDPESYRLMQNVGVLSPLFLAEAAFPHLKNSKNENGGTVVMIGSVSGKWIVGRNLNFCYASKDKPLAMVDMQSRPNQYILFGID